MIYKSSLVESLIIALLCSLVVTSGQEHLLTSSNSNKGNPMKKKPTLHDYYQRRDFSISPEPRGKQHSESDQPIFVIQKHAASHLHYDFRLELNGVLKSWAIPKGPSTDPKDKRLAMPTEDHPMEYATFEGTIPEGEYGAGTVMVWDIGTFENIKQKDGKQVALEQSYKNGQIEVILHGKKLKGAYTLIRLNTGNDRIRWLFIKMRDEYAHKPSNPIVNHPRSALTNRTMTQIRKESDE